MLLTLVNVVHILVALFMIFVVLVQGGNQGGVGAALGGGSNAGSPFGAGGAMSLLGKLTYGAAAVFMVTTLSLTIMQGTAGDRGIADKLSKKAGATQTTPAPATDPAPATQTTPAPAEQVPAQTQPAEGQNELSAPPAEAPPAEAPPAIKENAPASGNDGDTD